MITKPLSVLVGLSLASISAYANMSKEIPAVPGEILVKLKDGASKSLFAKSLKGGSVKKQLKLTAGNFALIRSTSKSTGSMIASLKSNPAVVYAEPNYLWFADQNVETVESKIYNGFAGNSYKASAPADDKFSVLWGLANTGSNEPDRTTGIANGVPGITGADVDALRAWDITKGSRDVVIAIIDTGIDYNHPDLAANIWTNEGEIAGNGIDDDGNGYIDDVHGWNAALNNGNPMDGNGHGTHCAGTIGAVHDNGGVAGVMGEVRMMAVKFLTDTGSGSSVDAIESIDYATKMNVDIMSNSWGGGGYSQALVDAITAAKDKGILFVAAAGNSAQNNDATPNYPSNYDVDNVIAVAAHAHTDQVASFSCIGRNTVDVAAPGVNILSTVPNNRYAVYSGTSMATPHVSGVLGLLVAQEGRLPVLDVRERIKATSIPTNTYRRAVASGGRVSAYNLLTDTRPVRTGPNPNAWSTEALATEFATPHPYANNVNISQTYTVPGARFIRVVVEKYETESGYDFLHIISGNTTIEKLAGSGTNYISDYVEGDSITLKFTSDSSQTGWGVSVKEVQVIR